MLSVILICRNEAGMVEDCLRSIAFADEIIILDSGSQDRTVEIVKRYTPHVFQTDWQGYGIQKNRALSHAKGDWVLSIDADERVSSELAKEIQEVIKNKNYAAYEIPFEPYFLGQKIKFGDWRNDCKVRLFQRMLGRFDDAIVHENLKISGPIGKLKNTMLHFSYLDQSEIDHKVMLYAEAGAEKLRQQGRMGGFYIGLIKGSFAFIRGYLIKLGFLDGLAGLKLAWMNARCTFLKYFWVRK